MVGVGRRIWEGGRRKSFLSLPPVQAHRPRSEKFKLGGQRLRGESWEEALHRYSSADLVPGVQKLGGEKFASPPPRARWALAHPNFAFQDIGEVPALISFYSFSSFALYETSWDMKRGGGLESKE